MTNNELEKALEATQKSVRFLSILCGKLVGILQSSHTLDDLDVSYIEGHISDEEYAKKRKEQNNIGNLFMQMFQDTPSSKNKDGCTGDSN